MLRLLNGVAPYLAVTRLEQIENCFIHTHAELEARARRKRFARESVESLHRLCY
jgi:hypothetical protein